MPLAVFRVLGRTSARRHWIAGLQIALSVFSSMPAGAQSSSSVVDSNTPYSFSGFDAEHLTGDLHRQVLIDRDDFQPLEYPMRSWLEDILSAGFDHFQSLTVQLEGDL